jgi:hypothetical protein
MHFNGALKHQYLETIGMTRISGTPCEERIMTHRESVLNWQAIFALVSVLSICSWLPVAAQEHRGHMSMRKAEIQMPEGAEKIILPLKTSNGHIILPVSVNGSKPLSIVLDTGMPMPGLTLFDHERIKSLNLKYGPNRVQIGGAGGDGQHFEARMAGGARLAIGEVDLTGSPVIVLPPIPHFAIDHAGVIGADIFRNFVVEVNHDRNELTLWKSGSYKPKPGAAAVALDLKNNLPYVDAILSTQDRGEIPLRFVMDLGATHPVSLNKSSHEGIQLPEKAVSTSIGRGLSGDLFGHVGRIQALSLGGLKVKNIVATFPGEEHENPRGVDSLNGNLGMGVLSRFNFVIDYSGSTMYLEPAKGFTEPFEWNMTGLTLFPGESEGLVVQSVLPDSPAASAGLKKGDILFEIDGKPVARTDRSRLVEVFQRNGAEMNVKYRRGESVDSTKLQLRRLI